MLTSLKSADAKASVGAFACGLPYSFSKMVGFSLEVTARIAALAFAISRLASSRSVEGRGAGNGTLSAAGAPERRAAQLPAASDCSGDSIASWRSSRAAAWPKTIRAAVPANR